MSHSVTTQTRRRRVNRDTSRTKRDSRNLHLELMALQTAIADQERKELKLPILDEKDFATRLPQINRAYKQTHFDSYLRSATTNLHEYLRRVERQETYEYWKARTLLYELNVVFNISPEINQRTENDAGRIHEELLAVGWDKKEFPLDDRKVLREKVLLCAYRGNELRRQGKTHFALSVFEQLMNFTVHKLRTDAFPCYGTRATLSYHMGATLRALEQHTQAERMYSEALDLLCARAKKIEPSDYLHVARKQAMVVGLGFGWINMTRGFLDRAEHALTTAKSLLASVNDPLVSSYVELLYETVNRCRAGSDKARLEAVTSKLQRLRRAFMDHPRYQARTCWELALAKTLIGDLAGAQEDLRFVGLHADRTSNPKWQVNVKILQSRIYQKQGRIGDALALAEVAVDKAKSPDCRSILPLVDAYITRGEAYLLLADSTKSDKQYLGARGDFETALHYIMERKPGAGKPDYLSNPKIASVCTLRIAQCYARLRKQVNAKKHFAIWLRLEPHVEHEWVRELAEQVKTEIDKLAMDFTISAYDHQNWSYSENVANLRRWLLTQSLRQTNQNYSEAAKLIGVQRTTLYQWQMQPEESAKRHRARRSEG